MSTSVFPTLPGLSWPVGRKPMFSTTILTSAAGDEVRISRQAYPRRQFSLVFDMLRVDAVYAELQQLEGFFNALLGAGDSFLFSVPDDSVVAGQGLGSGDGATVAFQLVRAFGGFTEPVLAPQVVSAVYLNGVLKTLGADYSVSSWGATAPGVVTFTSPPGLGVLITADFSYYFPVRFTDDSMDLAKFLATIYRAQGIGLITLKSGS